MLLSIDNRQQPKQNGQNWSAHITCSVPAGEISIDYWWGFLFTVFHVNIHHLKQRLSQKEKEKTSERFRQSGQMLTEMLEAGRQIKLHKKKRPLWIYIRLH